MAGLPAGLRVLGRGEIDYYGSGFLAEMKIEAKTRWKFLGGVAEGMEENYICILKG